MESEFPHYQYVIPEKILKYKLNNKEKAIKVRVVRIAEGAV